MKAAVLKVYNAPEVAEFQAPEAQNGLKVVEMLMAGLSPADMVIASGLIPATTPSLPAVVGLEGVGIMDGKRVYFDGAAQPFGSPKKLKRKRSVCSLTTQQSLQKRTRGRQEKKCYF